MISSKKNTPFGKKKEINFCNLELIFFTNRNDNQKYGENRYYNLTNIEQSVN